MSDREGLWLVGVGWVTYRMWRPSGEISASLMSVRPMMSSGLTGRSSPGSDRPGADCASALGPTEAAAITATHPASMIARRYPGRRGSEPSIIMETPNLADIRTIDGTTGIVSHPSTRSEEHTSELQSLM